MLMVGWMLTIRFARQATQCIAMSVSLCTTITLEAFKQAILQHIRVTLFSTTSDKMSHSHGWENLRVT
jgi:hypothetical protein